MKNKFGKKEQIAQQTRYETRTVAESFDDEIKECLQRLEKLQAAKASLPANLANMNAVEAQKLLGLTYHF